jgi:hypothetical protein
LNGTSLERLTAIDCGMQCIGADPLLDSVLVTDLAQSVTLLAYAPADGSLSVVARDARLSWPTGASAARRGAPAPVSHGAAAAAGLADVDGTVAVCDALANLCVSAAPTDGTCFLAVRVLTCFHLFSPFILSAHNGRQPKAECHLGDPVARFVRGSLSVTQRALAPLTLCSQHGALSVVARLPRAEAALCSQLQNAIRELVPGMGVFAHGEYRRPRAIADVVGAARPADAEVIDLEFVLAIADQSDATQSAVAARLGIPVDEMIERVRALSLTLL